MKRELKCTEKLVCSSLFLFGHRKRILSMRSGNNLLLFSISVCILLLFRQKMYNVLLLLLFHKHVLSLESLHSGVAHFLCSLTIPDRSKCKFRYCRQCRQSWNVSVVYRPIAISLFILGGSGLFLSCFGHTRTTGVLSWSPFTRTTSSWESYPWNSLGPQ